MKMKKILSMGALALVIASSTSVASFAATSSVNTSSLSDEEKAILTVMAEKYKDGGNFLGVTKDTKISDKLTNTTGIQEKLKDYDNGLRLLNYINLDASVNDNAHSIAKGIIAKCDAAGDATAAENEFQTLKNQIKTVGDDVLAFDEATGTKRADKEAKLKELLSNKDGYTVTLGKNSEGVTTISIENGNTIELQVSRENVDNMIKVLDTLTLQDLKDINAGQNNILKQ